MQKIFRAMQGKVSSSGAQRRGMSKCGAAWHGDYLGGVYVGGRGRDVAGMGWLDRGEC